MVIGSIGLCKNIVLAGICKAIFNILLRRSLSIVISGSDRVDGSLTCLLTIGVNKTGGNSHDGDSGSVICGVDPAILGRSLN